jgi:hypothetical protein
MESHKIVTAVTYLRGAEAIREIQAAVASGLRNELPPSKNLPKRLSKLASELQKNSAISNEAWRS